MSKDKTRRGCRLLVLLSLILFPTSLARAALDPETEKPYQLQVVLRMAENRVLTPVFRDLVRRQLGDSLQAALGDLAHVEIVSEHPLVKDIETRGLQRALDGYSALSDTKTHFVLIDYVNGRYEIRARQYDGFTGLASPVVRHSSTADRVIVARSAALLIDQDFGLSGTIDTVNGNLVDVKLRGGGLGIPLGHWVQKDQVFAVSQIRQAAGKQQASRRDWTLLQVLEAPHGAVCRCRLYSRWQTPLPQVAGVGYRCLKLGTTRAPLRLRLVTDDNVREPVRAMQVQIKPRGFEGSAMELTSTRSDGLVISQKPYENVAFVILAGPSKTAQVPVEIVEDLTLTCPVSVHEETLAQAELRHRGDRWLAQLIDSRKVADSLFAELNAMKDQPTETILARAEVGLNAMVADMSNLALERDSLRAEAASLPQGTPLDLARGDALLDELQKQRTNLEQHIGALQKIVTEQKDPRRRKWQEMIAQADLQEREDEFDKAIQLYKSVLAERTQVEGAEDPALRRKLDALTQAWTPKNDAHAKARAFIYETWPKLETAAQINARLDEARKAFQTCKDNGDILTPRKLLKTYAIHSSRLEKEVNALRPTEREADAKTAETIVKLTPKLKELNDEVKEYLRKADVSGK